MPLNGQQTYLEGGMNSSAILAIIFFVLKIVLAILGMILKVRTAAETC